MNSGEPCALPRLAFSTLGCPTWSWSDFLRYGREYGFQGIEIRMVQGETDLLLVPELRPDAWPLRRQELVDQELTVCGLASSVALHHAVADDWSRQFDTARRYIELAVGLGGAFVRVFGDVLISPEAPRENPDTVLKRIAERLDQLGEASAGTDVSILIETHGDFLRSDLLHTLMRRVTHPRVGVLWDTHHPWYFADEPTEQTLETLRPWLRHTHWKDSRRSATPQELSPESRIATERARKLMSGHQDASYTPFGAGTFPAENCLQGLRSCGYSGWYCLEWEKAWHPEIADPHQVFPGFTNQFLRLWHKLSS